jgi:Putative Ig domain
MRLTTRLIGIVAAVSVLAAVLVADAAAFNVRPNQHPPAGLVGQAYPGYQVMTSAGDPPFTFTIGSGGLPPGLTMSSSGYISGTPTQAGKWGFWVRATQDPQYTDPPLPASEASMEIEIGQKLTVTTGGLPFGTVGVGYSQKLSASGPAPYSWSVAGGTLPPGLTLGGDGTLAGTPTTPGTYQFIPKVSNGSAEDAKSSGLVVEIVAPLALTKPDTAPAVVGAEYKGKLTATGGKAPYTYVFAGGTPPPGLVLNPTTGDISGIPTAAGTYNVMLSVTDALSEVKTFATPLTVVKAVGVGTVKLPLAKLNTPYRGVLLAIGGAPPFRWQLANGELPRGIKLAPKNGLLVGKPRVAGSFDITVQVTDKVGGVAEQPLTLTVRAPKLVVIRRPLHVAKVGKSYIGRIWARGGMAPKEWEIARGSLPAGVTMDADTGKLRGTPTRAGKARFVIRVTDALGNRGARYFVLRIRR